jgi:hypothetical protein
MELGTMTEQTFPWQKDLNERTLEDALVELKSDPTLTKPKAPYDPCLFVRLRIAHGNNVQFIAIKATDSDITGEISFDNGTKLTVKAWGIPTSGESFMTSAEVMKEIQNYVQSNGLNLR